MRLDTARRFALSLPETTEEPHFEKSSFRVKGKIFATVPQGGKHLHIYVDPDEARALIDEEPRAYEEIMWGRRPAAEWLRVNLPAAGTAQVRELLEGAWRSKAPKKVLAAYDERHDVVRRPWRRRKALRVWSLHHLAFGNIGDRECTPFRWFSDLATDDLDLRDESLSGETAAGLSGEVVVLGGGGLFLPLCWKRWVGPLFERGNQVIGWGIGHHHDNVHLGPDESHSDWSTSIEQYQDDYPLDRFSLLGVRDWDVGIRWVPDASCMHPAFDASDRADHDVVVYEHGVLAPIPLDVRKMSNVGDAPFEEVAGFLASGRVVVTNSYHGAYWATLLGRPTVLWEPWCSKFLLLRYPHPWVGPGDWERAAESAPVYPDALAECRAANRAFAADVVQSLQELIAS